MSCPLYIRSVYTLLSSMCSIENIVTYGKKYGYSALGLVDKNVLSGAMAFKKACIKENIKPIYGLEIDVKDENRLYSVILYAQDDEGYKNLMALSSHICTQDDKYIDINELSKYCDHNILCLLSDNMPLTLAIDLNENIEEVLNRQNELFKHYIVGLVDNDKQINRNRNYKLKEILKQNNIKYIALSKILYLEKNDYEDYEILKCIRDKKTINDKDNSIEENRHFLSKQEFEDLYDKEEFDNCDLLVKSCEVNLNYRTSLPTYQNNKNVESKDYLRSLCEEGLRRRLKNSLSKEYVDRLKYELDVIIKMHFENYFLIVYDYILFAKKNNIFVGPGRGSGAGSLVAYCLGITEVDPIEYGLIFERFLNPERISMPDLDIDFPDDRRDEVIEYVKNKYGQEYVGHIVTYGTMKAKQVLRDVGRAMGINNREVDGLCKLIPNVQGMSLMKAYDNVPLFKQKIEADSDNHKLFKVALKLEFFPRHESTHPAGIVLSSKVLSEIVPVIKIENDVNSTQYTMEHLEELGLIKMDFLSLRNLTTISEICDEINKYETFNIRTIPLNDAKTFSLIDNVNVLGVFQLESKGMRDLIRRMKPRTFEELGTLIALFRPGPMDNISQFLANRENPEKINYMHPNLKPILKETYGIIIYQEQIMNIARLMAGFSFGKADILRKAMSKKKKVELEKLYEDFIEGCIKNGYTRQIAEKIYNVILEFANYGFNKSHSVAYSLITYELAYLKANYPLFFYKSLLNGVIGSETKTYEYISECQNVRQELLGISINESNMFYRIENNKIRMPLSVCKDVGGVSIKKIMQERSDHGKFKDYVECVTRLVSASVEKNVIENLINAGAFDEFGYSRYAMNESLSNVLMYASAHKGGQFNIDSFDDAPIINDLKDNLLIRAEKEKEVLGFYFSYNPIEDIKKRNNINTVDLYTLSQTLGYVSGFGLINNVKAIKTKKGDNMAFVDISDDKGKISLAIMPNIYNQYAGILQKGKYILFDGKIDREASCLVKTLKIF